MEAEVIRRSVKLLVVRIILLELLLEAAFFFIVGIIDTVERMNGLAVQGAPQFVQIVILVLQLGLMLYLLVKWSNEYFILKGQEVVIVTGILQKQEKAYPYNNIQSVVVRQGVLSRILNAGTVAAYIPTLGQELEFVDIDEPRSFANKIKEALPYPDKGQFILKK